MTSFTNNILYQKPLEWDREWERRGEERIVPHSKFPTLYKFGKFMLRET